MRMMMSLRFMIFGTLICFLSAESFTDLVNGQITTFSPKLLRHLSQNLKETGGFYIPRFLNTKAISSFKKELESIASPFVTRSLTVFQDNGDYENFTSQHPRNFKMTQTISLTSREDIRLGLCSKQTNNYYKECSEILGLYYSLPLLSFWRLIINELHGSSSNLKHTLRRQIYLSHDEFDSVYGLRISRGERSWHFNEHAFTCVLMLQRSQGESLQRAKFRKAWDHKSDPSWDQWPIINAFLNLNLENNPSSFPSFSVEANEGDVYCFYSDEELFTFGSVAGDAHRLAVVFSYADREGFQLSHKVNEKKQLERVESDAESDAESKSQSCEPGQE